MTQGKSKKILFIGHSLIEFFDWEARFPSHDVKNLGVAGESVQGLLARTEKIIRNNTAPDILFIMSGINNIAMEDFDFFDSYRAILLALKSAYPPARIYVFSLLPVTLEFISPARIKETNEKLKKLAEETGVIFLDLHTHFVDEQGLAIADYLRDDGVHLSSKGYMRWAELIQRIIQPS